MRIIFKGSALSEHVATEAMHHDSPLSMYGEGVEIEQSSARLTKLGLGIAVAGGALALARRFKPELFPKADVAAGLGATGLALTIKGVHGQHAGERLQESAVQICIAASNGDASVEGQPLLEEAA